MRNLVRLAPECPMADVLAGKVSGVYDGEVHVQRPDGSRVIVIVNIADLVDDNGAIVGAVNSFYENPLRKGNKETRDRKDQSGSDRCLFDPARRPRPGLFIHTRHAR